MTLRHSTIRQLQVFVEAAHTLSFARVAERLGLTPAAVSFQIKQIEGLCGFALFERVGRRVVLTEAGAALLEYASVVLKALTDADERMQELKGLSGGHARIGLVSTAKYIMPRMLSRFQAEYPRIAIHLHEGNRRDIIAALLSGEVDIAVMGKPPDDADVAADPFAPHPSVLIAPPGHRLAGQKEIPLDGLAEERFIVREEGSGTRALMENFFRGAGFTPRIALTSSSNETIKQAVMAGMGVALISRHTIVLELRMGLLTVLPVQGLPLMRSWFVAWRRHMPLLPVHTQLRRFLLAEGKSLIAGIESAYRTEG
ncbi:LysR family transcriptional regulator [Skermanella rosea]|uniref:LysR family transcriptional regulator n=1 Tax=Skermanella rosea TaxID=1817965 RepID=UPI0019336DE0|nr:LysR family transcriptional regulator [Skermanella rosea]UEM04087.1 LysR family transcriptional regulator [Skermanella rosea]